MRFVEAVTAFLEQGCIRHGMLVLGCLASAGTWAQFRAQTVPLTEQIHTEEAEATPPEERPLLPGLGRISSASSAAWEGRVGAIMERRQNPLKDSYVLLPPAPQGGQLRGVHVLSDFYLDGGFRATAGLIRGTALQSLWDGGGQGLNVTIHRLDCLSPGTASLRMDLQAWNRSVSTYIGAGYSARINHSLVSKNWRVNADIGWASDTDRSLERWSRSLSGEQSLNSLVKDLQLKPLVKFSVGTSF